MEQSPRRWSWWWWLAAVPIIAALVFVWWLRSDSDLRAIDARAAALGVPRTWAETGYAESPPAVLAAWRRIEQLGMGLKAYTHDERNFKRGFSSFDPSTMPDPDALRRHHAALPEPDLVELITLVQALPENGVHLPWKPWSDALNPAQLRQTAQLTTLLLERASLHAPDRTALACAIKLTGAAVPNTWITETMSDHAYLGLDAGLRRLVAQGWTLTADEIHGVEQVLHRTTRNVRSGMLGEWCWARALCDPRSDVGVDLRRHRAWFDQFLPAWMQGKGLDPLMLRICRASTLLPMLDLLAAQDQPAPAAFAAARSLHQAVVSRFDLYGSSGAFLIINHIQLDARLRLLIADLRGDPRPADPTDPAGHTVRSYTRAGKTGAYLLGLDGVDNHASLSVDYVIITGQASAP